MKRGVLICCAILALSSEAHSTTLDDTMAFFQQRVAFGKDLLAVENATHDSQCAESLARLLSSTDKALEVIAPQLNLYNEMTNDTDRRAVGSSLSMAISEADSYLRVLPLELRGGCAGAPALNPVVAALKTWAPETNALLARINDEIATRTSR